MGPHFNECGNEERDHDHIQPHKLQWGRTSMSAETRLAPRLRLVVARGFNGAALQ